jgi:hypothetical protein
VAADPQVLLDGELGEDAPALHHLADARPDDARRVEAVDRLPLEADRALGDRAAVDVEEARDRAQHGRLAGAVRAEQRDDRALGDLDRDALEHEDDVLVHDLEVLDDEHAPPSVAPTPPRRDAGA